MEGKEKGENVRFAKMGSGGRAKYVVVRPRSRETETWFNERGICAGGGAVDDGGVKNPELPVVPS